MRLLALAVVSLACVANAHAADPNSIFGRWVERLPTGNGIVTEFAPQSIEAYSVDRVGHRGAEIGKFSVSYRNLSPAAIRVHFQGSSRSILVFVKNRDTIILGLAGTEAHTLKRLGAYP